MASMLLDAIQKMMRRRYYSIRTEWSYYAWVKRYVLFYKMRSRADLRDGEKKIEAFLNHLAIDPHVVPSTQNQALNAIVFLYKHVLKDPLDEEIYAARAPKRLKLPVVLTREEITRLISLISRVHQLVIKLLYGSGLHIIECLRLRLQDIDFGTKMLTLHDGKGSKNWATTFPPTLIELLREHLNRLKMIHENDLYK